jgi:hypothetical protein
MRADEARLEALDELKVGPPHQRAIGKHPEVFRRVQRIRVHGCDIEESAIVRKPHAVRGPAMNRQSPLEQGASSLQHAARSRSM